MLFEPDKLAESDIDKLMKSAYVFTLVDEICFQAISKSTLALKMMKKWIEKDDETYGRGGWALACSLITQNVLTKSEIEILLSDIEAKMKDSLLLKQEVMNRCLCEIGIKYEDYTEKCIKLGEKLEVYKGQKVSKGCTSSYAPEWISVGIMKRKK